jgi:hypothetical protein
MSDTRNIIRPNPRWTRNPQSIRDVRTVAALRPIARRPQFTRPIGLLVSDIQRGLWLSWTTSAPHGSMLDAERGHGRRTTQTACRFRLQSSGQPPRD